jgi:hypothetical protein
MARKTVVFGHGVPTNRGSAASPWADGPTSWLGTPTSTRRRGILPSPVHPLALAGAPSCTRRCTNVDAPANATPIVDLVDRAIEDGTLLQAIASSTSCVNTTSFVRGSNCDRGHLLHRSRVRQTHLGEGSGLLLRRAALASRAIAPALVSKGSRDLQKDQEGSGEDTLALTGVHRMIRARWEFTSRENDRGIGRERECTHPSVDS